MTEISSTAYYSQWSDLSISDFSSHVIPGSFEQVSQVENDVSLILMTRLRSLEQGWVSFAWLDVGNEGRLASERQEWALIQGFFGTLMV